MSRTLKQFSDRLNFFSPFILELSMSQEFDPALQIKDLDTGKVVTIEEYEQMEPKTAVLRDERQRSLSQGANTHPLPQANIPKGVELTKFLHAKKSAFYSEISIDQVLEASSAIRCVDVSPDGSYAAIGCEGGEISIFSYHGWFTVVRRYKAHDSDVTSLAFSSDNMLFSSSMDGTVKLWHPSQSRDLAVFKHDNSVTAVALNPADSSVFLACTFDNKVVVWNARDSEVVHTIDFMSPPTAAAFSPSGGMIAIGCYNGTCFVYATEDFRYVTQFVAGPRAKRKTSNEKITSILFPSDSMFFVATNDSRLRLYSAENFSVVRKFIGHETKDGMLRMSISPDSKLVMCGSEKNGGVVIWPIEHEAYYKGRFGFTRERTKTCEGFCLGPKTAVTATAFMKDTTLTKFSVMVTDEAGHVFLVKGQKK